MMYYAIDSLMRILIILQEDTNEDKGMDNGERRQDIGNGGDNAMEQEDEVHNEAHENNAIQEDDANDKEEVYL